MNTKTNPADYAIGMAFLKKCGEKYKSKLKEPSQRLGPGAVSILLWELVDRLYILESMFSGDGEWRKQTRWPIVQEMLKREAEWKEAAEAAKTAPGGLGTTETTKLPSEAEKGHTGENGDIHEAI